LVSAGLDMPDAVSDTPADGTPVRGPARQQTFPAG
jgi:hypothetical protein